MERVEIRFPPSQPPEQLLSLQVCARFAVSVQGGGGGGGGGGQNWRGARERNKESGEGWIGMEGEWGGGGGGRRKEGEGGG